MKELKRKSKADDTKDLSLQLRSFDKKISKPVKKKGVSAYQPVQFYSMDTIIHLIDRIKGL